MTPPIPSVVQVKTRSGSMLTFRVGAIAAAEDLGRDMTRLFIAGAAVEVCAPYSALCQLLCGNLAMGPVAPKSAAGGAVGTANATPVAHEVAPSPTLDGA